MREIVCVSNREHCERISPLLNRGESSAPRLRDNGEIKRRFLALAREIISVTSVWRKRRDLAVLCDDFCEITRARFYRICILYILFLRNTFISIRQRIKIFQARKLLLTLKSVVWIVLMSCVFNKNTCDRSWYLLNFQTFQRTKINLIFIYSDATFLTSHSKQFKWNKNSINIRK